MKRPDRVRIGVPEGEFPPRQRILGTCSSAATLHSCFSLLRPSHIECAPPGSCCGHPSSFGFIGELAFAYANGYGRDVGCVLRLACLINAWRLGGILFVSSPPHAISRRFQSPFLFWIRSKSFLSNFSWALIKNSISNLRGPITVVIE